MTPRRWLTLLLLLFVVAGCGPVESATTNSGGELAAQPPATDNTTVMPVAMRISSIGLDSTAVSKRAWLPLGFNTDGSMEVPEVTDPTRFGFYCPQGMPECGAPYPGQVGGSVVVSHVNGGGKPGGFYKLDKVKVGDTIEVDLANGVTNVFRVTQTLTISKKKFPVNTVWGAVNHPRLSLITCGGVLDRANHNYLSNIVVVADLTTQRATQ